jgi:hypothetical protein
MEFYGTYHLLTSAASAVNLFCDNLNIEINIKDLYQMLENKLV